LLLKILKNDNLLNIKMDDYKPNSREVINNTKKFVLEYCLKPLSLTLAIPYAIPSAIKYFFSNEKDEELKFLSIETLLVSTGVLLGLKISYEEYNFLINYKNVFEPIIFATNLFSLGYEIYNFSKDKLIKNNIANNKSLEEKLKNNLEENNNADNYEKQLELF
jgi:hypothetical protein